MLSMKGLIDKTRVLAFVECRVLLNKSQDGAKIEALTSSSERLGFTESLIFEAEWSSEARGFARSF